jgi:outer membrane protein assembly factor BamB
VRRALAAAAAASFALAGCSTYNPLIALGIKSEPANKPTPLAPISAIVTPKAAWSAAVGKSGGFVFRPDIEGGRVYTAASDGSVSILDQDSGRQVAKVDLKKKLSSGVEVGDSKIFVGTPKGEVIAVDVTGKTVWTTALAGEIIAPVSLSRSIVVARTSDGRIFGLSAADGKRLWVFQRPTPSLLLRSEAGVIAAGGDVVAGYPNGKLIALDIDDGKLTWEATVALPRGATELERIADVSGLPLVDGTSVCASAFQGKTACFEIQTRNQLWSREVSTAQALTADGRGIYLVDDASNVHALDKKSGASLWKQDKLLHRRLTAPVAASGQVVVGDGFGFLHVIAPETGNLVGRHATDGTAIVSIVPVAGGGVLVQTAGGQLSFVRL